MISCFFIGANISCKKFLLSFLNPLIKLADTYNRHLSLDPLHPPAFSSFLIYTLIHFFSHIFFPSSRFVCLEQIFFHTFLQLQRNSCHRNEARGWTLPLILTLCKEKLLIMLSHLYSIISIGLRPQPQPLTFTIYQLSCIS